MTNKRTKLVYTYIHIPQITETATDKTM